MSPLDTPSADATPAEPLRPRRLGWTFWAGLTFGLVCLLLGATMGVWGARIVPPLAPPAPAVLPAEPAAPAPAPRALPAPAPIQAPAPATRSAADVQALVAAFPDAAARAVVAARDPGPSASPGARARHWMRQLFTVRRTDRLTGADPDAVLARAQRALQAGDIDAALRELEALPVQARLAMADWRAEAARRVAAPPQEAPR